MTLTSLALIANDDGHHERAARLVGAAARIRDELGGGVPPEFAGPVGGSRGGRTAVPRRGHLPAGPGRRLRHG
jgi:hypothetical protein